MNKMPELRLLLSGRGGTQTCFLYRTTLFLTKKALCCAWSVFMIPIKMGWKTFSLDERNTEKRSATAFALCMNVMGGLCHFNGF